MNATRTSSPRCASAHSARRRFERRLTLAGYLRTWLPPDEALRPATDELAALLAELENKELDLDPACAVACKRLLSQRSSSTLLDPALPWEDVRSAYARSAPALPRVSRTRRRRAVANDVGQPAQRPGVNADSRGAPPGGLGVSQDEHWRVVTRHTVDLLATTGADRVPGPNRDRGLPGTVGREMTARLETGRSVGTRARCRSLLVATELVVAANAVGGAI